MPIERAVNEIGMFRNQNTVCVPKTPKWRHKVERLKQLSRTTTGSRILPFQPALALANVRGEISLLPLSRSHLLTVASSSFSVSPFGLPRG